MEIITRYSDARGAQPRLVRGLKALCVAAVLALSACGGGDGGSSSGSSGPPPTDKEAATFLRQASFGPTQATIAEVKQKGFATFLADQFALPVTAYPAIAAVNANSAIDCPATLPAGNTCYRDKYTSFPVQNAFFANAVSAPDQLRQRVAFALGQIFVISNNDIAGAYAIREYHQMLLDNAFGNFRTLLYKVTLNPAMGDYLDMVNNDKAKTGVEPNENYARELMQLFSVGLYLLNPDGSLKLDARNEPIPTYDQEVQIEGFARAFTGWTYPTRPGATAPTGTGHNFTPYYLGEMMPMTANHETGTKALLNGVTLPANQTPQQDLNDAIDNIFNHPNVGPFIGKQLIQFLVTSNPSPAYVSRVTAAFNNNGAGVRGDMRAVLAAILLDSEARNPTAQPLEYGQLREPALFLAGLVRSVGGGTDGVYLNAQSSNLSQKVFNAPTVFNFYPPSYPLPGDATGKVAPQFGIQNATTTLARWNVLNTLVYSDVAPDTSVTGSTGTALNWSQWLSQASNATNLIDAMDLQLSGGVLDSNSRALIRTAVETYPATDTLNRARTAAYLILAAPQTMIGR